jgi:hypothetical protein
MISDTTLPHGKEWGLFCCDWREGAKLPCREVVRKDQPGSLGTEEKAPALSGYWPPHAYTFERYEFIKEVLLF